VEGGILPLLLCDVLLHFAKAVADHLENLKTDMVGEASSIVLEIFGGELLQSVCRR
jgi:hypothetical protein